MARLKKLSLSRILKLDLRFLEQTTQTLEMFDVDELRMRAIYEVLEKQEHKIQVIDIPYGKHPLTKKIAAIAKLTQRDIKV